MSAAVEQSLLAGVPTYNVLRNPIYARMFRINDEFAASHRHVQSVYHMQVRKDDMEAAAFDINLITQHHQVSLVYDLLCYILCESYSQFDSLPLTSLRLWSSSWTILVPAAKRIASVFSCSRLCGETATEGGIEVDPRLAVIA